MHVQFFSLGTGRLISGQHSQIIILYFKNFTIGVVKKVTGQPNQYLQANNGEMIALTCTLHCRKRKRGQGYNMLQVMWQYCEVEFG